VRAQQKTFGLVVALIPFLFFGQFTAGQQNSLNAQSIAQKGLRPACSANKKYIENDMQAIEIAKKIAFEPNYNGENNHWDTVFKSDFYRFPKHLGISIKGMFWSVGRGIYDEYTIDFRYDDGDIDVAIFALIDYCGALIDRGHVMTNSRYPEYRKDR
jgi:hypothetical protein